MLQMAVAGTIKKLFCFWTPHGMIIDEIYFDNKFWCSMKNKFQKHYEHFFEGLLSSGRVMLLLGTLLFGIKTFEA